MGGFVANNSREYASMLHANARIETGFPQFRQEEFEEIEFARETA
jgi:hypothetical protein